MIPEQVFAQFPEAEEIFKAGNSEYFLTEDAADDYCSHFKVKKEKLLRSSFFGEVKDDEAKEEDSKEPKGNKKPTKAELKAKEEADAKAAAELKAKEEADAKAAAELKAKEEADAKAAAELKAKEEAEPATKEVLELLQDAEKDAQEAAKDAKTK